MTLNTVQRKVAEHYDNGSFSHVTTMEEARGCGDTLFVFCLLEAEDCDLGEAQRRISRASDQLMALAEKF